ncbi:metal ABC transporter permease [Fusobacterium pseudoperiodonticum]|jgi:ABC-type Mn2+/Zn2+ transport systems, permease components|uniref:Metal ABC transporter permease n=1 Tax=Fusobacterium pseudoperiodonticum TaxID=2663009 RepID=A0A2D3PSQ4_9FUSO|nr:metal ABC transporter permease [Fusobacterium pseudoperiodonticum]ATV70700.1 metal ABC transporter permease [Fusobacterium pseudoperiodonticum]
MSASLTIQLIAILISVACSLLGVFLVLRSMSMLTDAISHTVLLGIVLSFFITHKLDSPLLIVGATLTGLLTVYFVEVLSDSKLVKEDAAIGIVLSILFSVAVILISKYTANIHLDIDAVLLGEIAFAPFHTTEIFGFKIATGLINGFAILVVNLLFITIFFKEIKISIFDKALALTLGLLPEVFHYLLMTLVSVTSVVSFDIVGATLMISFMVGPATTAYMISKNLKTMLVYSSLIGVISSIIGYHLAVFLDVSISGSIAVVIGVIFFIVLFGKRFKKYVKIEEN